MENRANYPLVGLFATLVVLAVVGFVYWFMNADGDGEQTAYAVVFEGAVTGLSTGTDVLFNGLRVGSVTNVRIDSEDPNRVVARIAIDADAPVRTDTQAILEIQGLTGGANIQLLGGAPDAPVLTPNAGETIAVLRGEPSDLQAILEGAGSIVESAESAFSRIDGFLSSNETRLATTLANIEALSNSLAGFAAGAGQGNGMQGMVESLAQSIESANVTFGRIEGLVAENGPTLTAALGNAERFSATLADNADSIDAFLAGIGETGDQIGPLTQDLRALSADLRTLVEAVPPERLTASIEGLEATISGANSAVDTVNSIVSTSADGFAATLLNMQLLTETTAANAESLNAFLLGLGEASGEIGPLTADLRAASSGLREIVESVPPEQLTASIAGLEGAVTSASSTFAGVDALVSGSSENIAATLANTEAVTRRLSETLSTNASGIDAFLAGLGESGDQIGPLTSDLRAASADFRALVAAVPPERLAASMTDLEETIAGANSTVATIDTLVSDNADGMRATLANLELLSETVGANAEGINAFLLGLGQTGDQIGPLTQDLRALSTDLRTLVQAVPAEDLTASIEGLEGAISSANSAFAGVDALVSDNAGSLASTLANAEAFSFTLAENTEGVDQFLASLTDAATLIGPLAEEVQALSADLGDIAAAISPEQVAASLTSFRQTIESADSVFATVDTLVSQNAEGVTAALGNVEQFSTILAANSEGVNTFLASVAETSEEIAPLAQEIRLLSSDLRALVEVVPPQQVAQTFTDVSEFADSLARNTDNIDTFFVDAGRLAGNLSGVSQGLQETLELIDEASGAIDAEVIGNAMENIDAFSVALGRNAENIDQILGNTRDLTDTLTGAATRIDTIIARVDELAATEGGESLFTDLSAAALAVRSLAEDLEVRAGEITGAVTGFANTGLDDYSVLASEARVAVQQLQRVLSEIERNPQVVVFGGDTVRDFQR